ncbi:MAG: hypothetical protein CVU89_08410 [Firmicutes bacterium HGW-Firmicutes-14]|jgi:hypothetical protein|nr:MAG: hypothetical protein CVU89_08410 [Firmicutes bacterium HGW-Firmicutes-14]
MNNTIRIIYNTGLVFFALIVSLGIVGYSAAAWNTDLHSSGSIMTGNIDPVFTDVYAVTDYDRSTVDVDIWSNGGKSMFITINDACPDTQVEIKYTITNRGSVPIKFSRA